MNDYRVSFSDELQAHQGNKGANVNGWHVKLDRDQNWFYEIEISQCGDCVHVVMKNQSLWGVKL